MSSTVEPETESESPSVQLSHATDRLRQNFAACRVKFKWFGVSKSLTAEQKTRAAESFGAEGRAISAGKKLIDTRHEAYKGLTTVKSQITRFWKDNSLPYPESGIRLIRQDKIDEINGTLETLRIQLQASVESLNDYYAEMKDAARTRLGSLFNASDYPVTLADEFEVVWDFPSVEPPDYLRQLNPDLYQEQARRVSQRFERAVELAEQAFVEELDRLVNHLAERLDGSDDGRPRIFRDSAVTNLADFFTRFRELNIQSSQQLDELVVRCEQLMQGVQPQVLRDNDSLRQNLATQLARVQSSLDQMIIDQPRRNIIRPARQSNPESS